MVRVSLHALAPRVAAIVVTLAFALGLGGPDSAKLQTVGASQADFELAIDANIENGKGPCDPIDSEAYVDEGAVHRVAVCILNPPEAPTAFLTRVLYDGRLNKPPEMPDVLPALDDNPDANAGDTTFSSPDLGDRWDCSGMGMYPPRGDDEYTPDKNDAVLACNADLREPDATLVGGGPLEVITFEVVGRGDDRIEFDPQTQIGGEGGAIGRCGELPAQTIPCHGAVIHKGQEASQPKPTTGASPGASLGTPTPGAGAATVTPGGAMSTGQGATPKTDEGGGFPWAVVGGTLGGVLLLIVVVGGLYAWRRGTKGSV